VVKPPGSRPSNSEHSGRTGWQACWGTYDTKSQSRSDSHMHAAHRTDDVQQLVQILNIEVHYIPASERPSRRTDNGSLSLSVDARPGSAFSCPESAQKSWRLSCAENGRLVASHQFSEEVALVAYWNQPSLCLGPREIPCFAPSRRYGVPSRCGNTSFGESVLKITHIHGCTVLLSANDQ
jgi:hypothetical protein